MAAWVGKKYAFDHAENWEAFTAALGLTTTGKNWLADGKPVLELSQNGNEYTLTTTFKDNKSRSHTFQSGVEFEDTTPNNRTVLTTFTFENPNTLVQTQKGEKPVKTVRVFTPTTLVSTATVGGVTSTTYFNAE